MFEVKELGYSYDALEPHIDTKTMEFHYSKHYVGYTNNLNKALDGLDVSENIEEILRNIDSVPEDRRQAVINNGGGYANHSLFWETMSPDGGAPSQEMRQAIIEKYGSFESFQEEFKKAALTQFGSGWAWLLDNLEIVSTSNQDSPLMKGLTPILGLDVWEHAYYLNYQNRRGDYIDAWWNVVDWGKVEGLYKERS